MLENYKNLVSLGKTKLYSRRYPPVRILVLHWSKGMEIVKHIYQSMSLGPGMWFPWGREEGFCTHFYFCVCVWDIYISVASPCLLLRVPPGLRRGWGWGWIWDALCVQDRASQPSPNSLSFTMHRASASQTRCDPPVGERGRAVAGGEGDSPGDPPRWGPVKRCCRSWPGGAWGAGLPGHSGHWFSFLRRRLSLFTFCFPMTSLSAVLPHVICIRRQTCTLRENYLPVHVLGFSPVGLAFLVLTLILVSPCSHLSHSLLFHPHLSFPFPVAPSHGLVLWGLVTGHSSEFAEGLASSAGWTPFSPELLLPKHIFLSVLQLFILYFLNSYF